MSSRIFGSCIAASIIACGVAVAQSNASAPPLNQIRTIALERGGCNACPHYSITFSWDGRVQYHGSPASTLIGDYSSDADFSSLADWVASQKLDGLAGVYGTGSADVPSMKLTIVRASGATVIDARDASAAPLAAIGAGAVLDGYIETPWWRPTGPLDTFVGWFLDDSKPGELRRLHIYPMGYSVAHVDPVTFRPDPCSPYGFVVSGGGYEVAIDRLTRSATLKTFDQPPVLTPIDAHVGTIEIKGTQAAGVYRRVSEQDIDQAEDRVIRDANARTCVGATPTPLTSPTPPLASATPPPKRPHTPIESVTLARSFCLPICSHFSATYRSDGTATFHGISFADPMGYNVGHVDFARMAAWLDAQDIDSYDGTFGAPEFDARETSIHVVRTDRTRTSSFWAGGSRIFRQALFGSPSPWKVMQGRCGGSRPPSLIASSATTHLIQVKPFSEKRP